jgi:DNA-3-methyladenine glycosylase II
LPGFAFTLSPRPPFRLDLTVWTLRRRAINQTDRWYNSTYLRSLLIGGAAVEISVIQTGSPAHPTLHVRVEGVARSRSARAEVADLLDRTLGLQVDLAPFYQMAKADRRLGKLVQRFSGMKPPRFPTTFEALLNGMSCQQVSLEAGLSILNRLVSAYGQLSGEAAHAFPRPDDLAGADVPALRSLGYSRQKSLSILQLADGMAMKRLALGALNNLDDASACAELIKLHGVGRWTAEYVLLRGLGRTGVFPADDVGARNGLRDWLGCDAVLDYASANRAVSRWQPYAGLLYFHLLLRGLSAKGVIPS